MRRSIKAPDWEKWKEAFFLTILINTLDFYRKIAQVAEFPCPVPQHPLSLHFSPANKDCHNYNPSNQTSTLYSDSTSFSLKGLFLLSAISRMPQFCFKFASYLSERQKQREGKREILHLPVHSQMAAIAETGPD